MAKFDEIYTEDSAEREGREVLAVLSPGACEICGEETYWTDPEAFVYICSEECHHTLWNLKDKNLA